MTTVDLPNIREPFIDTRSGQISRPWWLWLQQLMTRVGGSNGTDLTALAAAVTTLLALTAAQGNQIDGFVPLPPDTDEQADEGMVYVPPQDVAGSAPVQSVFGRTGDVLAQAGDYTVSDVTNAASVLLTLAQFAATTSAQLKGVISDETGSGALVFGTSPTLTTPVIASIVNTGTLTVPTSTDTLVGRATTDTLTNKTLTSPTINSPTISGGTINNTPVGATTAHSGRFTDIVVTTGGASVTGGLTVVTGGAGIAGGLSMTSGAITPISTTGITGTTTNDNAVAGAIGEYQSNSASGTALTSGVAANATSIVNLPAGDWDVEGIVQFVPAGTTTVAQVLVGINTVSATFGTFDKNHVLGLTFTTGASQTLPTPVVRISLAAPATVYVVAQAAFGVSTMTCNGFIRARRVR